MDGPSSAFLVLREAAFGFAGCRSSRTVCLTFFERQSSAHLFLRYLLWLFTAFLRLGCLSMYVQSPVSVHIVPLLTLFSASTADDPALAANFPLPSFGILPFSLLAVVLVTLGCVSTS